jgi:heptosyltransferase-3
MTDSPFHNILLIKLRNIGDVLLSTPVARRLKEVWPGAKVTFLVNNGTESMVTLNPHVDEVLVFQRRWKDLPLWKRTMEELRFIYRIRSAGYDLAVNLTEGDRGAVVAWWSGASRRIGWDPKGGGFRGKGFIFDQVVGSRPSDHMIDRNLSVLDALGMERGSRETELYFSEQDADRVERLLADAGVLPGEPIVHVHPAARWLFKCWPAEKVAGVVDHFRQRYGMRSALTSSSEPRELRLIQQIREQAGSDPVDLSGRLTLKQTAALSRRSAFYFGVDTAPMHMAGAVGVPVAAVFGPSDEGIWGPHREHDLVLARDMECRPCKRDGCDGSKVSRCLEELEVSEVVPRLDDWLAMLHI